MKISEIIKCHLLVCLILITFQVHAQTHYELMDESVYLRFTVQKKGPDSIQIVSTLKNYNEKEIWIMEKNIFKPGVEGDILYLNMGLDLERHSPMDIVPFPLKALGKGDSISYSSVKYYDKYASVILICNYLLSEDYNTILKEKDSTFSIGLLDYKRLMKSNYMAMDIDCSNN